MIISHGRNSYHHIVNPLPPGYTKYDWIKFKTNPGGVSTRFFYLDIGNAGTNKDCEFIVDSYQQLSSSNNSVIIYGGNGPTGSNDIYLCIRRNSSTGGGFRLAKNVGVAWPPDNDPSLLPICTGRHQVSILNDMLKVDGTIVYQNASLFSQITVTGQTLAFMTNETNINMKLYNVIIKKNDAIIYDYVPCVRDSDEVIGIYDKVNNTFNRTREKSETTYYEVGND